MAFKDVLLWCYSWDSSQPRRLMSDSWLDNYCEEESGEVYIHTDRVWTNKPHLFTSCSLVFMGEYSVQLTVLSRKSPGFYTWGLDNDWGLDSCCKIKYYFDLSKYFPLFKKYEHDEHEQHSRMSRIYKYEQDIFFYIHSLPWWHYTLSSEWHLLFVRQCIN